MKVSTSKEVVFNLTLTIEEAHWLKDYVQNYPGEKGEEESSDHNKRVILFDELKDALINVGLLR